MIRRKFLALSACCSTMSISDIVKSKQDKYLFPRFTANGCTLRRVSAASSGLYFPPKFVGATVTAQWDDAIFANALMYMHWLEFGDAELTRAITVPGSFVGYSHRDTDIPARILLGLPWIQHCMGDGRSPSYQNVLGEPAISAMLAHEVGHLYQYKTGLYDRLTPDGAVIGAELHADFMAGFSLSAVANLSENHLPNAVRMMNIAGDNLPLPSSHHGTPAQRVWAIRHGYKLGLKGNSRPEFVADAGFHLVRNMLQ